MISRKAIRGFSESEPKAREPLLRRARTIEGLDLIDACDLRRRFGSVDFVGDPTVFNIGGNKYRLIAFVHYRKRAVYIKRILTHDEYDKGLWKQ